MSGSAVKTSFFSPDGEFIDEWRTAESTPGSGVMAVPYVVLPLQDRVLVSVFGGMGQPITTWRRDIGMVAFGPDEAEYRSRTTVAQMRRQAPDFDWNGAGIPATKPWIRSFVADRSERIWVSREGRGKRVSPCTEDPVNLPRGEQMTSCWQSESLLDVFDRNGECLGSLERPEGLQLIGAFFRGDFVVAGYYDELDIPKVRLYRLVLPEQRN